MPKNFSMYGLPETVKFCKLCVNSNQKPNTVLGDDGVQWPRVES